MSIADLVTIVNSNPMEPLNFNQYLTDICTFGANSYVFAKGNEKLFHALLNKSAMMYGHKAIHDVIYARLTSDDIDFVINSNSRLGKHLNMFYAASELDLSEGDINNVLKTITFNQFNKLEKKFQEGFSRYFDVQLTKQNMGMWLDEISETTYFNTMHTLQEVFNNTECYNCIKEKENLRLIIVNAAALYNATLPEDILCELLPSMLESVTSTEKATGLTIQNLKLDYIFGNLSSMQTIAKNNYALNCLIQSAIGFKGFVNSEHFAAVFNNKPVIDATIVVLDSYRKYSNDMQVLQENLNGALECGTNINPGTLWSKEIQELHKDITTTVTALRTSIEPVANTIANGKDFLTSTQMRNIFVDNPQATDALFAYDAFCASFFTTGGAATFYAQNDPIVIYSLLQNSEHFKDYLLKHQSIQTTSNAYTNNAYPFIIVSFVWENAITNSTATIITTGKNFYTTQDNTLKLITKTTTLSDPKAIGLSGWRGEEMILFAKTGCYILEASSTTGRQIGYYVFK